MIWTATGGAPSVVCPNRPPTLGPDPPGRGRAAGERAFRERAPDLPHEVQIEVEVVHRRELGADHLAREDEMTERPATEVRARVARTAVLDRSRVASVRGVANHQLALSGEQRPVPRVASREHAVEQVIPHAD